MEVPMSASSNQTDFLNNQFAQDEQLLGDFLVEAGEHLTNIEQKVLVMEEDPSNHDALHSMFRSFHTITGLAGFLELHSMQRVAHEVETLLDLARGGRAKLDCTAIDSVLAGRDYLGQWVSFLGRMKERPSDAAPAEPEALVSSLEALMRILLNPGGSVLEDPPPGCDGNHVEAASPAVEPQVSPASDDWQLDDPRTGTEAVAGSEQAFPAPVVPQAELIPEVHDAEAKKSPALRGPAAGVESTPGGPSEFSAVKVNTAKLEYLVDMVGELVIAQSIVRHDPDLEGLHSPRMQRNLAQLSRVTAEVQKTAMAMRMVEIGVLFQKMRRLVRDLAKKSGKRAELEVSGEDVEIDRTIVEELSDPMVHMLRNSMDHWIEMPEEREAAGKPSTGKITLRASHQGGQIVVEIADDGRGLNRERIVAKAVQRGLIESGERLTDAQVYGLIFAPGFSTAERITEVSGRGVGMGVVQKQVEKLRGSIEIDSTAGQGSCFKLKLPLTLAIIEGLVVKVGPERYIVPLSAVREMFRPAAETLFTVDGRREVALVRSRLLPVVRLYQRLAVTPKSTNPCEGLLIVGEAEGREFCLLVDELLGKQEVVI
jgi:two-component system chemotaxis sensor kinase CheA